MNDATSWWDGVELWLAGLPFIPQVALVIVVVLPIAAGLAVLLDRVLSEVIRPLRRPESEASSNPHSVDDGAVNL